MGLLNASWRSGSFTYVEIDFGWQLPKPRRARIFQKNNWRKTWLKKTNHSGRLQGRTHRTNSRAAKLTREKRPRICATPQEQSPENIAVERKRRGMTHA